MNEDFFLPFVAVLCPCHRHNEARTEVEKGLELLSEYRRLPPIKWPGTKDVITECLPANIEVHRVPLFLLHSALFLKDIL